MEVIAINSSAADDKACARRMLLLSGGDNLSCRFALRLEHVLTLDDPKVTLQGRRPAAQGPAATGS